MKTRQTLFITAVLAGTLTLLGCPPAPTPQQQGGGMGQGTMHDQGTGSGQRMMDGQGAGTGPGAMGSEAGTMPHGTTPPPK